MNKEKKVPADLIFYQVNAIMKKIFVFVALPFILLACSDVANDKQVPADTAGNKGVDTSVTGSDNPNPVRDTTVTGNKIDSLKNQLKKKPRFQ